VWLARCGTAFPVSMVVGAADGGLSFGGCARTVLVWEGVSRGIHFIFSMRVQVRRVPDLAVPSNLELDQSGVSD